MLGRLSASHSFTVFMKTQENTPRVETVRELLAYKNPDADKIIIDAERATCTLNFQYSYEVDLDRIQTERDLLAWVRHLANKAWMNGGRVKLFIDAVARHKGFRVDL